MSDYWLGFATTPLLVTLLIIAARVFAWVSWWFGDRDTGWGYVHDMEEKQESGRWCLVQHVHRWPPGTPLWLGRWLEPMRVRLCLRDPDYRAADWKDPA